MYIEIEKSIRFGTFPRCVKNEEFMQKQFTVVLLIQMFKTKDDAYKC